MSSNNNGNDETGSDESVSQFLALTGSSDASQAQSYLEMSAYNVETAVNLFFEHQTGGGGGGFSGGSAFGGTGSSNNRTSSSSGVGAGGVGFGGDDDVRAPDQTRTMRLMDFEGPQGMMGTGGGADMSGLLNHPILGPHAAAMMNNNALAASSNENAANQMMAQMSAFADDVDVAMNRDVRDMINASTTTSSNANASAGDNSGDGHDDDIDNDDEVQFTGASRSSHQQVQRLNDLFAPPIHLIHTAGGFQGARNVAKNARRWLLVNLQNDSDFSCHALNRDVWRDELVENLVREGFIFWQSTTETPDGNTYAQRYNVQSYPHIGILDPRTARLILRKEGWTQENPLTAEKFAELAADFCSRNSFDKPPSIPRGERNVSSTSSASHGSAAVSAPPAVDRMTEEEQLQAAIRASMNEASGMTTSNDYDNNDDDDDNDHEMDCEGDDDEYEYIDHDDYDNNDNNFKSEEEEVTIIDQDDNIEEVKEPSFHDQIVAMDVGDEPEGTDGVARIMIRMPDGKRLVRKFKLEDPVKIVYAFIAQSNDDAKGGKEFGVKAGFPPKDLLPMIDDTIKNCGLAGDSVTVRWSED